MPDTKKVQLKTWVSADLKNRLDILLFDSMSAGTLKGALSRLTEQLFRRWIEETEARLRERHALAGLTQSILSQGENE